MLYREIIAVCSQIYTKHFNAFCGQNAEFLNVKAGAANGRRVVAPHQQSKPSGCCMLTRYNSQGSALPHTARLYLP